MTAEDYLTLIQLGLYQGLDLIQTRAELMLLDFELKMRIASRRLNEDTDGIILLERKRKAISCLMKEFDDAKALTNTMNKKYMDLLRDENDEDVWFAHRSELHKVDCLIKSEKDAIESWLSDSRSSMFNKMIQNEEIEVDEKLVFTTGSPLQDTGPSTAALNLQVQVDVLESKHGILSCLRLLKDEQKSLATNCMFEKAEAIDIHICLLEELNQLKSSRSELAAISHPLKDALSISKQREDWNRAKNTKDLLDTIEKKKIEVEAKTQQISIEVGKDLVKILYSKETARSPPPPNCTSELNAKKELVFNIVDNMLLQLKVNSSFKSTCTMETEEMSIASSDRSQS
jgi:hypothetical protein